MAAIAADRDGVIYQRAAGPREAGQPGPVTVDTMFRIMSMTKMPCTVACVCGSIYSNFLPFVTPEAVKLYSDFERALYASL